MAKVIILRGVSGAGKSFFTQKLRVEVEARGGILWVVSADHFFMDDDGVYNFDAAKLSAAHGQCLRRFVEAVQMPPDVTIPEEVIVVDNTSTSIAEIAPYAALALAYGHELEIVTLDVDPEIAAARNVHGVPLSTVKRQLDNLHRGTAQIPKWWNHRIVNNNPTEEIAA